MNREKVVRSLAFGVLTIALVSASSVCLDCHTSDIGVHSFVNASECGAECQVHHDCRVNRLPDCNEFLSLQSSVPPRNGSDHWAHLVSGNTIPAPMAILTLTSRSVIEDSPTRRVSTTLLELGLSPRLI